MMTRKEKYAEKRKMIEKANLGHLIINPAEHLYIIANQKEIKKEKGCRH